MSAEATALPAGAEGAPKKGKKKLILILLIVLLLVGGGGAGYYFLAKPKPAEVEEADEDEEEAPKVSKKKEKESDKKKKKKKKGKEKAKSEFMTIEPWFTFNLMDKDPERSGQIGLVFEITNTKTAEELKFKMPVVRSKILFLVSGKFSKDLKTPEGKEKLQEEILELTRGLLEDLADGLEAVHFSIFVVQ